jgi:DNA repair exonuclease SbcCD nuclease subunit
VDWILNNKDKHQSELVIISGDVVDDGKAWQFEQAKEQLERLRENEFTVLVCPGNHDYGPEGVRESHLSQEHFFSLISGEKEYPHLQIISGQAFILLDSMAEEIKKIEMWGAQGNLGEEQLQKLDQMLEDLAENPEVENVLLSWVKGSSRFKGGNFPADKSTSPGEWSLIRPQTYRESF